MTKILNKIKTNRSLYIFRSILSDKAISIFLLIQMFILLITANLAIGEYNSRTMIYKPVEAYLNKPGFFVYDSSDEEIQPSIREKLPKIIGSVKADVLELKQYSGPEISFSILPDDIYEKLVLPVSHGSLFSLGNSENNCQMIVTPNSFGYEKGKIIEFGEDADIEISAVLTDPTYIMHMRYNKDMSYEDMYMNYISEYYDGIPELYTCESEFAKLKADPKYIIIQSGALVALNEDVSPEDYNAMKDNLRAMGMAFVENKVINDRSQKTLSDDFKRFIPSSFVFGIITLTGILSCSIIGTKTLLKKLAIFYCCGATKKDCMLISVGRTGILILLATLASIIILFIFKIFRLFNLIGFIFGANNVIVTFGIVLLMLLLSMIAPIILISKNEPHEIIAETADE